MSAVMMVRDDRLDIDPKVFTPGHLAGAARRRARAERAAHLRQRRDQEGAVPRGQGRPQLACQDPAVVGPRLSLPHPHGLPARQQRLQGPDRRRRAAKAARRAISPTGSRIRCCTPSRRTSRRSRATAMTLAQLPAACRTGSGRAGCQAIASARGDCVRPVKYASDPPSSRRKRETIFGTAVPVLISTICHPLRGVARAMAQHR